MSQSFWPRQCSHIVVLYKQYKFFNSFNVYFIIDSKLTEVMKISNFNLFIYLSSVFRVKILYWVFLCHFQLNIKNTTLKFILIYFKTSKPVITEETTEKQNIKIQQIIKIRFFPYSFWYYASKVWMVQMYVK